MVTSSTLLVGTALALVSLSALAQTNVSVPARRYPKASLGLSLGYGSPYGFGVDVSVMVASKLDVNIGTGFSLTGGKLGLGTRYYFAPQHKVSPFAGVNFVHSGGFDHLNITDNNNSNSYYGSTYASPATVVNFKPTNILHLRGGVRWQPIHRFAMLGALGYGIVLGENPVEYVDPSQQGTNSTAVSLLSPGGIELSIGVAFGLD